MLGIQLPDHFKPAQDTGFKLLDENAEAFRFFQSLRNYWVMGFSGVSGLDHSAVMQRIDRYQKDPGKGFWLLEQIEAIESGCLQAWADQRAESEARREGKDRKPLTLNQENDIKARRARRC